MEPDQSLLCLVYMLKLLMTDYIFALVLLCSISLSMSLYIVALSAQSAISVFSRLEAFCAKDFITIVLFKVILLWLSIKI